ncbi:MAG: hypothetical protein [Caudoviricetes sp.]|nr:MAG: hypothetical protein [Caudoviricetes sp.]
MNNDLEQFSEEFLNEMIAGGLSAEPSNREVSALARIALAAKRSEVVAYMTYKGHLLHAADPKVLEHSEPQPLYDAPQPAHTEQDGWIKCSEKLPDDDSFVLVTNGKHNGMGAYLRDDHLEDDERWQDEHFEFINKQSKYPVTHWMPLPPNPEE